MFLKIAKEQYNYYHEDIVALLHKGNSILEFCYTPLLDKSMKITKYKKQKLKEIIKNVSNITETLTEILSEIKDIK